MIGKAFRALVVTVLILVIGYSLVEISKDNPKSVIKSLVENSTNWEGKKLTYKAKFLNVIPTGMVTFSDQGVKRYRGIEVFHLSAQADTFPCFSSIFKARAVIDSYIHRNNLYSLRFAQHLEIINKPDEDKEILYDQRNKIMTLDGVERVILDNTHDPLSLMHFIRKQEFVRGKKFKLNLNTNQKNYDINIEVLGREETEVDGKVYGVWILDSSFKRHDKSPRHSSSFKMWILDSETKPPILIKAMTNAGPATTRLVEIK